MPAQCSTCSSSTGGSFVEGSSSHNQHRFPSTRDDLARPYPSAHDVYRHSNVHNPDDDEFTDLGLSDFFITHRRVARRKLERLQLSSYQAGLLSRGVQVGMERREPYNAVLEAAMGYAGACSVAAMDDVVLVNEKVDVLDEGLGEQTMRIDRVNQDLMEWATEFTDERVRARESDRFLSGRHDLLTIDTESQVGRIENH